MPRMRSLHQISVKLDDATYWAIDEVGRRWGFLKPDGDVNMARTTAVLLAEYLSDKDPGVLVGKATEAAKLAIYAEIKSSMLHHLDQLRQELEEIADRE